MPANDAADLAQDGLVQLYRSLPDVARFSRQQLEAKVRRILQNQLRASRRKHKRHAGMPPSPSDALSGIDLDAISSPSQPCEESLQSRELYRLVRQAMAGALQPCAAALLRRRFLDGASLKNLAEGEGASVSCISNRVQRALARLREALRSLLGSLPA